MKHNLTNVMNRFNKLVDKLSEQAIWEDVCDYDMAPPVIVGYKTRKAARIERRIARLADKYNVINMYWS